MLSATYVAIAIRTTVTQNQRYASGFVIADTSTLREFSTVSVSSRWLDRGRWGIPGTARLPGSREELDQSRLVFVAQPLFRQVAGASSTPYCAANRRPVKLPS